MVQIHVFQFDYRKSPEARKLQGKMRVALNRYADIRSHGTSDFVLDRSCLGSTDVELRGGAWCCQATLHFRSDFGALSDSDWFSFGCVIDGIMPLASALTDEGNTAHYVGLLGFYGVISHNFDNHTITVQLYTSEELEEGEKKRWNSVLTAEERDSFEDDYLVIEREPLPSMV